MVEEGGPSIDEQVDVIHTIYVTERITFNLRTPKEVFTENWPDFK